MFVPSNRSTPRSHERFEDVIQKAHRARIVIVSPSLLMLTIQVLQAIFQGRPHPRQAGLIKTEVVWAPCRRRPTQATGCRAPPPFRPGRQGRSRPAPAPPPTRSPSAARTSRRWSSTTRPQSPSSSQSRASRRPNSRSPFRAGVVRVGAKRRPASGLNGAARTATVTASSRHGVRIAPFEPTEGLT